MGPEYPGWDPDRTTGCFDVEGNNIACAGTSQPVQWELADGDFAAADALLTEAGYPAGSRFNDIGPLPLQTYCAETGCINFPIADQIVAVWAALGIDAYVEGVDYVGVVLPRMRERVQFNPVLKNGDVHSNVYPLDWPMPPVDTSASRPGWGVGFESPAGAQWLLEILAEQDPAVREQKHLAWVDYSLFWVQYAGVYQVPKGIVVGERIQSWNGRQQHYSNVSTNPEFIALN
jgi:ABC-type transport system substrate-binding protein